MGAGVAGAAAGLGAGTVTDCPAEADDNGGTGADKPLEIRLLLAAGGVLVAGATTVVAATDWMRLRSNYRPGDLPIPVHVLESFFRMPPPAI